MRKIILCQIGLLIILFFPVYERIDFEFCTIKNEYEERLVRSVTCSTDCGIGVCFPKNKLVPYFEFNYWSNTNDFYYEHYQPLGYCLRKELLKKVLHHA